MCSHENKYDQGKQPTKESRNRVERVGTPWLHECWKAGESLPQIRSGRTMNSIQRGVETTDNNLHANLLAEQFQTRQGRNRDIIWFVHAKLISATKHDIGMSRRRRPFTLHCKYWHISPLVVGDKVFVPPLFSEKQCPTTLLGLCCYPDALFVAKRIL